MEEKNKREKGIRPLGKATAESCGRETAGGSVKRRREERALAVESEGDEGGRDYPSVTEGDLMTRGVEKMTAILERMEELDRKWSVVKKGGTTEEGTSS